MTDTIARALGCALRAGLLALPAAGATAQERVTFGTNWLPQAEHGGFYQSVADGTYAACGLEVTIVPGGPQVNNRAMLMAGRLDFFMGGNLLALFNAVEQDIPMVALMASFQKEAQVLISHPGVADTWEDLRDLDLLIADAGYNTFFQWMIAAHGFRSEQRQVYTFNPAPFLANERLGMQGFLSSEPHAIREQAGFEPNVFLLADYGWDTYATQVETMRPTLENRPEVVECFVEGSILGWYNFLYGDNEPAIAMILAENPEMSRAKIDYAIERMIAEGIVDSGDTLEHGIGYMDMDRIGRFFDAMVAAGVVGADVDWTRAFDLRFVGHGLGMELRPE
ncbi:ABC transporter substrate-binding protein [Rhodobaculum claviforme]|uniref:Nitrate ABC transporter substrate-binding protein n=1 Tax=Rhodobaculum claviforme TaxID=1549854 RepID=A0A934TDU1_9RHOB|nr:ABC transporter substrate-binding protein [Rhodobaculum claviforme]MBK5925805.1 nitrate ABC transporter substrate-binding protein [Rhodobaculum claviforme]